MAKPQNTTTIVIPKALHRSLRVVARKLVKIGAAKTMVDGYTIVIKDGLAWRKGDAL